MGITLSGMGSGLDINSLVKQLMSAEQQPMKQIKSQESSTNSKISAYGQLSSSLSSFQTAVKGLSGTSLGTCTATSSSTAITITTSSGATPGNYNVQVSQLAQAAKLVSAGYADATTSLGTGTLAVSVAGGANVTLAPSSNSLNDLRDSINAANLGMTASIVDDGSANGKRLMISGKDTGAGKTIALTGTGALSTFSFDPNAAVSFGYDGAGNPPAVMSQTQQAQDAMVSIDGMKITSATNTISNALPGVTMRVSQTSTTAATIDVQRDTGAIKSSVNAMVKAWNDLKSLVGTQTAWNETTKTGAVLHGDSGPASILRQIRNAITQPVSGAGDFTRLTDIGISFQKDGTLAVNDSKLQSAISNKTSELQALFAGGDGVATRIGTLVTGMLGESGVITSRTSGLNTTMRGLTRRETTEQARLDAMEARYRAQYTRLDTTLASMQNTSTYLAQQLAKLS